MFRAMLNGIGKRLADYLTKPRDTAANLPVRHADDWQRQLRPCDVLLVDGSSKISKAIKYLTTSTWSHAALYVGPGTGISVNGEMATLIEADMRDGVRAVPLSHYAHANVRICRPAALHEEDVTRMVEFALDRLGHQYDLQNVFDLARYLLPEPPIPRRWRRRLLELGSGEPTRAICSTLIAQAFQSVGYPILPQGMLRADGQQRFRRRHHTFITPRDFDLSPYFAVIKPSISEGFDYRSFPWATGEVTAVDLRKLQGPALPE